ncbi:MAG: bifunctional (p)ppGpp synthetase/guanosine-3',5'-bis(diphosphate) 3'-pyrophosphohydrolase, partial [Desulfuromonadales bacterium]|nr:bifunctional (p)ppGpp synthetase/guanosine-3',5'-bis(diphosphate) 3'-pyrophosphohydrolase [Desulfuromonadales bacterium]
KNQQAESLRKMLVAMARDLRVILVKLADRLHNMRTLEPREEQDRVRYAQETLDIYAPLANRLGISWVKTELENLAFRYLHPEVYQELQKTIAKKKKDRRTYIQEMRKKILKHLGENGISGEVSGRFKHLYSVYLKMERQSVDLDQIYDLIAFRVLVETVRDCYAVLGVIHEIWTPVPGRFKDYIAMPKANGYQSLHTTVIGPYGERMEVQIRTREMHRVAEEGIAAHWKYKEGHTSAEETQGHEKQFKWLRQLLEWQQELRDSREFMEAVEVELFPEEVYVFTPGGDVKELPKGSTPIDFAYAVHSDVGNRCSGARVNGKLVPLKTELQNGDTVDIVTSANQQPSKDWLQHVQTSKARNKIRNWVKSQERERSVELGREILEKEARKHDYSLKRLLALAEFAEAVQELGFKGEEDLLAAVGFGKLTAGQVLSRSLPRENFKEEPKKPGRIGKVMQKIRRRPSSAIRIHGIEDIMVRFAKCCNPVPGDPVVGYITRGRGVTVHAEDCSRVLDEDADRRIDV